MDRSIVKYNIGDRVWLYYPSRKNGLSECLLHRWVGLYSVIDRLCSQTYLLELIVKKSHTNAHMVRMKPYLEKNPQNLS